MNDSEDLARVLAERLRYYVDDWVQETANEIARAVLASGVVVSARDVKALADEWESRAAALLPFGDAPLAEVALDCAVALRSLLRGPATDAAPTSD